MSAGISTGCATYFREWGMGSREGGVAFPPKVPSVPFPWSIRPTHPPAIAKSNEVESVAGVIRGWHPGANTVCGNWLEILPSRGTIVALLGLGLAVHRSAIQGRGTLYHLREASGHVES